MTKSNFFFLFLVSQLKPSSSFTFYGVQCWSYLHVQSTRFKEFEKKKPIKEAVPTSTSEKEGSSSTEFMKERKPSLPLVVFTRSNLGIYLELSFIPGA